MGAGTIPLPELAMQKDPYNRLLDLTPLEIATWDKRSLAVAICVVLHRTQMLSWDKPFTDSKLAKVGAGRLRKVFIELLDKAGTMPSFRFSDIDNIEVALSIALKGKAISDAECSLDDSDADRTYAEYAGADGFEYTFIQYVGRVATKHLKSLGVDESSLKGFIRTYSEASKIAKEASKSNMETLALKHLDLKDKMDYIIDTATRMRETVAEGSTASLCINRAIEEALRIQLITAGYSISATLEGCKL